MEKSPKRIWSGLGVVETIYEDEVGGDGDTSTTLTPSSTPLHSRVQAWSMATGHDADAVIHVHTSSFCLHKGPLTSRSGYLRRRLGGLTELTISPPLNITAETFTWVAEFCYGAYLLITPFNVASLRIAAELLEMTEEVNGSLGENLRQKTEMYFRRLVSVNRDYASIVLKTCLTLLPEAETTAPLVSRCIATLSLRGDEGAVIRCLRDVKQVRAKDFILIVESMNQRLTGSHDLLYKMVDFYLEGHNGEMAEEEKCRLCNYIDCTSLSPQLLMHAVQNPRMPLRFIVQAMFVEQLNTRRSIVSSVAIADQRHDEPRERVSTLGAILQRDAALRQVTQLKAAMNATSSRIESLEKELSGMKKLLKQPNGNGSIKQDSSVDSGRSSSFRFMRPENNKIERGQIGSVSLGGFRFGTWSSPSHDQEELPRLEKRLSQRLVDGLKNAFRVPSFLSKQKSSSAKLNEGGGIKVRDLETNEQDVVVIKKNLPFHRR